MFSLSTAFMTEITHLPFNFQPHGSVSKRVSDQESWLCGCASGAGGQQTSICPGHPLHALLPRGKIQEVFHVITLCNATPALKTLFAV